MKHLKHQETYITKIFVVIIHVFRLFLFVISQKCLYINFSKMLRHFLWFLLCFIINYLINLSGENGQTKKLKNNCNLYNFR